MSRLWSTTSKSDAGRAFEGAVGADVAPRKRKAPAPFSLRLTAEERARLEVMADGRALGGYIKARVFDRDVRAVRKRRPRPVKDHAALAQVLGMLGNRRLAHNLNQIARAANLGILPLDPEVEKEVQAAAAAVIAMKAELMRALGYDRGGDG